MIRPAEEMAGGGDLTDYERQRLRRIEENRSRLAALGLPELTTSLSKRRACLPGSSGRKSERIQRKNKRASRKDIETDDLLDEGISASDWEKEDDSENDDDIDYEPLTNELNLSEYDDDDEDVDKDEEDDHMYNPTSKSNKDPKSSKRALEKGSKGHQQDIDPLLVESTAGEDEMALQQALALSLGSPPKDAIAASKRITEQADNLLPKHSRNEGCTSPKSMKRTRLKKDRKDILQFNEEEINALFLAFVGSENDQISFRELQDAAVAHDFTWSKSELDDMITFFDIDGNHKLNIVEFRNMAVRCNMLRHLNA